MIGNGGGWSWLVIRDGRRPKIRHRGHDGKHGFLPSVTKRLPMWKPLLLFNLCALRIRFALVPSTTDAWSFQTSRSNLTSAYENDLTDSHFFFVDGSNTTQPSLTWQCRRSTNWYVLRRMGSNIAFRLFRASMDQRAQCPSSRVWWHLNLQYSLFRCAEVLRHQIRFSSSSTS